MISNQEYAIKTIVPQEVYTDREEFLSYYYLNLTILCLDLNIEYIP
ncbi:hypothetical protein MHK_003838, partial [Candidatus Magnetomorum sp. HK-1]